ncbi:carbon-nitrogen hydrolase family protein [Halarsenatibacter silvermanii]|uniref:carbon-nitrogen hydrolase family protein n=1 Tax=Halarsenatibacter silvermanii TaxID=321763 RepID=UPI00190EAF8E|nr:carbon-nitrogen hydrolase family protein [Halarsenatibacter silvermanii]
MSENIKDKVTAAVVQASPALMDKEQTLEKSLRLIKEASQKGAEIVVFPESFLSGYPRGLNFGCKIGSRSDAGREDYLKFYRNSVKVPGEITEELASAAGEADIYLVMGVNETDESQNNSTIYNSLLYFGPGGNLLAKHQKLKPTGSERLIWGEGDSSTLSTVDTPYGTLGGLICWENYMPLARAAIYQEGVSFYAAPTADARDEWQSTIQHIALEGRNFVLACNQFVTRDMYPEDLNYYGMIDDQPKIMCRGGSAIIDPLGKYLAGPLYNEEGILMAELDLDLIPKSRMDFDVNGHYSRPDVFELRIH